MIGLKLNNLVLTVSIFACFVRNRIFAKYTSYRKYAERKDRSVAVKVTRSIEIYPEMGRNEKAMYDNHTYAIILRLYFIVE